MLLPATRAALDAELDGALADGDLGAAALLADVSGTPSLLWRVIDQQVSFLRRALTNAPPPVLRVRSFTSARCAAMTPPPPPPSHHTPPLTLRPPFSAAGRRLRAPHRSDCRDAPRRRQATRRAPVGRAPHGEKTKGFGARCNSASLHACTLQTGDARGRRLRIARHGMRIVCRTARGAAAAKERRRPDADRAGDRHEGRPGFFGEPLFTVLFSTRRSPTGRSCSPRRLSKPPSPGWAWFSSCCTRPTPRRTSAPQRRPRRRARFGRLLRREGHTTHHRQGWPSPGICLTLP